MFVVVVAAAAVVVVVDDVAVDLTTPHPSPTPNINSKETSLATAIIQLAPLSDRRRVRLMCFLFSSLLCLLCLQR